MGQNGLWWVKYKHQKAKSGNYKLFHFVYFIIDKKLIVSIEEFWKKFEIEIKILKKYYDIVYELYWQCNVVLCYCILKFIYLIISMKENTIMHH